MAEPIEIVSEFYRAYSSPEYADSFRTLDPKIIIRPPESLPYGGDFVGYDGLHRFTEILQGCWEDFTIEVDDLDPVGDDCVLARLTVRARSRDGGREFAHGVWELFHCAGDKIVDVDVYYQDSAAALGTLGVEPRIVEPIQGKSKA